VGGLYLKTLKGANTANFKIQFQGLLEDYEKPRKSES